eukprot:2941502-Rhodomonas_salina.1
MNTPGYVKAKVFDALQPGPKNYDTQTSNAPVYHFNLDGDFQASNVAGVQISRSRRSKHGASSPSVSVPPQVYASGSSPC